MRPSSLLPTPLVPGDLTSDSRVLVLAGKPRSSGLAKGQLRVNPRSLGIVEFGRVSFLGDVRFLASVPPRTSTPPLWLFSSVHAASTAGPIATTAAAAAALTRHAHTVTRDDDEGRARRPHLYHRDRSPHCDRETDARFRDTAVIHVALLVRAPYALLSNLSATLTPPHLKNPNPTNDPSLPPQQAEDARRDARHAQAGRELPGLGGARRR